MINELKIKEKLQTEYIGKNIVHESSTDSTNLLAKRNRHLDDGTLFVADMQTNGRGRLGREWVSQSDDGIYMSLLLKPDIAINDIPKITLICGIAVARIIDNSQIKYPNDIIIDGKKICGILCEKCDDSVICGVGINVNHTSFDGELSQKATSLYLQTNKVHSREEIIRKFLVEFEKLYAEFLKKDIAPLMNEYRKKCVNIGKYVNVVNGGKEINGVCTTVTDDGAIVIENDNEKYEINSGEVSVRGIYGYV